MFPEPTNFRMEIRVNKRGGTTFDFSVAGIGYEI
jgi:hypothetical protein